MKNALLWGFCEGDEREAMRRVVAGKAISAEVWFGNKDNDFDIEVLCEPRWIDVYRETYLDYTNGYKHDHQCYDFVYKYLEFFTSIQSRYDVCRPMYKEYTYFTHTFNLYFRFFYSIFKKKKIEICFFANIPHEGGAVIAYLIAKYLGIPTIIFSQSLFDRFFYLFDVNEFGDFPSMNEESTRYISIPRTFYTNLGYMKDIPRDKRYESFLRVILRGSLNPMRMLKKAGIRYPRFCRQREYAQNLQAATSTAVDWERKFVYFPLHLQPELTTHSLGGRYCDQLLALERLAEIIPDDWSIYAKENPKQTYYMRPDSFFSRLKRIKKVQLLGKDVETFKLIEKSQFVATITGTVGWEAVKGGKCVLTFGRAWYQSLPGVFKYSENLDIREILAYTIDHHQLEVAANQLISRMWDGVIDSSYVPFAENYSSEKNIESMVKCFSSMVTKLK